MKETIQALPDGWTIYIWLVTGVLIIVAVIFAIRWAAKNDQFDEDIKYLVFDENDRDKMDPEEFEKARQVLKEQIKKREMKLKELEEQKKHKKHKAV